MHIEIVGLDEGEVQTVSAQLDAQGLEYDVDYTTLYGTEWSLVGVRLLTPRAMTAGAGLLQEVA